MYLEKVEDNYISPKVYKVLEQQTEMGVVWYREPYVDRDTQIELTKFGNNVLVQTDTSMYIKATNGQYYPAGIHAYCNVGVANSRGRYLIYYTVDSIKKDLILVFNPCLFSKEFTDGVQTCSRVWRLSDAYVKENKVRKRYLGFLKITIACNLDYEFDFHIYDVWFYENDITQIQTAAKTFVEVMSMPFPMVGILKVVDMKKIKERDILKYIVVGQTIKKV